MYWPGTLLALAFRITVSAGQCGMTTGMTKIVGGSDVPSLRFPWYVALVQPSALPVVSVSCGGSLITNRHVLTAAHCFPKDTGVSPEQMYKVVFGLVNRCTQKVLDTAGISQVRIHPRYKSQTLQADVAVVTLDKAVSYTPICLPPKNSVPSGSASIIGFGSTLAKSRYPCTMQEAHVTILSKRECARSGLSPEYSRIPGTLCAGVVAGGVDSCDGDSGGPLQTVGSNGAYTIQGIVSFGEGCARRNLPGVYTQVSAYRDFIDSAIHSSSGGGDSTAPGDGDPPVTHRPLSPLELLFFEIFHRNGRERSSHTRTLV